MPTRKVVKIKVGAEGRATDRQGSVVASPSALPRVVRVPAEGATRLVTIDVSDALWVASVGTEVASRVTGAIVRLRPPIGADAVMIEGVRRAVLDAGAVAVRMSPVRLERIATAEQVPLPPRQPARAVCVSMAEESKSSHKGVLVRVVERLCDEVGL